MLRRRELLHRLGRLDPIGPMVAGHAILLAVLGSAGNPDGIVALGVAVLLLRGVTTLVSNRDHARARAIGYAVRGLGSLVLVGWMMILDGGTESPLFFSMLVVVVWEAVVNTLPAFIRTGIGALTVYLGVIVTVSEFSVASIARFGVYVVFIALLVWARALSDLWKDESEATRALAADILDQVPTGFVLFDPVQRACRFVNPMAREMGLDLIDETTLSRYGIDEPNRPFSHLLIDVEASGESLPPGLFMVAPGGHGERFLRIGVTRRPIGSGEAVLMVSAEDVSAMVAAGERQRRFLESANHQFRTPLSPIVAYSSLITQGELAGEELRQAGEAIRHGAERIENMLERISALLRLQRRPNRPLQAISVGGLIDDYVIGPGWAANARVIVIEGGELTFKCDPALLADAIRELAQNSLLHGQPPISIRAALHEDTVSIRIFDDGPGPDIEPDTPLDHTWGALSHPEVMPTNMGGRLGISYAFTLAQTAGGSLRFERNDDGWAFSFELSAAVRQVELPPRRLLEPLGPVSHLQS